MIEFEPSIDASDNDACEGGECDARVDVEAIRRIKLTPELLSKMTTSLEDPKTETMLDLYFRDKGQPEHTYIGRI